MVSCWGFGLKIKISALAMPMLVFGVVFSFQKKPSLKGLGNVLAGLGFFFLGIHYMKDGFEVFKQYIDLSQYAVQGYLGVLIYTGLGIIITTVLQSSSATLALILTALSAGQIEYENALALAIGANVGTTITAVLGAIGSNSAGKRLAMAHFIFNTITGLVAVALIFPLAKLVNYLSESLEIAPTNYVLKLALFHTIFNVLGVVIMLPFIKKLEHFLLRFFNKTEEAKDVHEPKYLNTAVLKFPGTAIIALIKESKYLYKNSIFEIVTHALNIHRSDVKSHEKIKNIIEKSVDDFHINVDELYYSKVKAIYGKIIQYASTAQSTLRLNKAQINMVTDIKIANRKMVEIIKHSSELNRNISKVLNSDNEYLKQEYDGYRKKIIKVLRVIYLFRTENDAKKYGSKLKKLKHDANDNVRLSNKSIDKLIRKNLITAEEASSLFNDYTNVNEIIRKLIDVAELLYAKYDSLLEKEEQQ
ncbi:Na/Pi cotransporter family protein [Jejuia pallidilutea]|uniref:Na/Pi cotransporter family protein n=1 Tax=Jejuia pallidilutea TaxID=504487 RepID=UPI0021CD6899|nr:Na/Pi symporter [Jejuia pallidilutea]